VTTFFLVRHAAHDLLGKAMAGRAPGVALNEQGRLQAERLVDWLSAKPIAAIYSSPQQRARETAAPLAAHRGLAVQVDDAFDEIDFGDWTGLPLERLRAEGERWRTWVEQKSIACPPGGEPFACVQRRAMAGLEYLAKMHPDETVCVVSHGDILKAVLASILGMLLDHLERLEIAPASLSIVAVGPSWSQVKLINAQNNWGQIPINSDSN
jgi:broad specificity phosphatase PhoE